MGELVNLDDVRPKIKGSAVCLGCRHEWVAVAPVGTVELECPECYTFKGVFEGMVAPDNVWQCDCGNQHFYISEDGAMCAMCGVSQEF